MTQMMSLTKYEHQVIPKLRDQLNQAESVEDVKNFLSALFRSFLALRQMEMSPQIMTMSHSYPNKNLIIH